jgi:hypothetical protein
MTGLTVGDFPRPLGDGYLSLGVAAVRKKLIAESYFFTPTFTIFVPYLKGKCFSPLR